MAKYCKFKCYMHGVPPTGWDKVYYAPMIGDSYIYTHVPMDGSTTTLLAASTTGYDLMSDCVEMISETLTYLPDVTFGLPYVSSASFNDEMFIDYLSTLSPNYARFLEYPWDRYYSPTATSDYGVGNITLSSGVCMCASFMKYLNQYPQGGENKAYMVTQAGIRRLEWEFTVFPYEMFKTGTFDFSVMLDSVSRPGDSDWKRYCNVKLQVWQYPDDYSDPDLAGKWNCFIVYYGYDSPIDTLNNNYQGTGTEVYDSGKPITPGQKNTDDPGSGTRPNEGIPIPNLPSGDMTATGSLRLYKLTAADIKSMFDYLHSHDPGTSIVKWWTNPIQGIISLHYLPYAMKISTAENIKVLGMDTGVAAYPSPQFQSIHFGYLDYELDSGTYLDYSPYTKTSIYLPGIGIRELNTDDVMNKRIWVVYHCDNVTGQFAAYVASAAKGEPESKASVKYCFSGQVSASFPVSQENWGNTYIAGATLAAGALATGVVAAGGAAAAGGGAAAGAAEGTAAGAAQSGITASGVAGAGVSIGNSLSQLAKPSITRSGAVTGTTSLFAVKKPYLIIESPNYYNYEGFDSTKGYPYGLYGSFKSLKGYAVIEGVHLTGIPATVTELNEIETLLKSGVHF